MDGVSQLQEEHARLSVENEYLRQALGDRGAAVLGDMDLSTLPPCVYCTCAGGGSVGETTAVVQCGKLDLFHTYAHSLGAF